MTSSGVFIVTEDLSVARAVGEVVDATASAADRWVCRNLEELSDHLARQPAAAAVVDIDAAPTQTLNNLQPLVERFARTKFIAIASEQREEWVHQAMHAGARDFLLKKSIAASLPGVLDRLIRLASDNGKLDHSIVTILSAGGGCGATTLAVNLATELHHFSGAATLLIDLDTCYGSLATYLGITAEYSIADVLTDPDRIDPDLVKSTAVAYRDHLHLLASPATTDAGWPKDLRVEHLHRALRAVRQAFTHTIIDAPRVLRSVAAELAKSSVLTLLILEQNVDDIRIAHAQLEGLFASGVDRQRVLPLISRFRRNRSRITPDEVKQALGVERVGRLSNDFSKVVASINFGKTLAETAPRSSLRRDIHRLARAIHAAGTGNVALGRLGK